MAIRCRRMDVHTRFRASPWSSPTLLEVQTQRIDKFLIAKVVDEFLVVGVLPLIHQFHEAISRRFIVGRYVVIKDMVFNRLHIHQQPFGSISVNMEEYVDTILPIEVSKERRQHQDKCSAPELKSYQALAGSLNFLGHGILPQAAWQPATFSKL